jgi:hypothetical protein
MNAELAKPIHAIWFIQARAVDLNQSLAAVLCLCLPSWLRDHSQQPDTGGKMLQRTIKNQRAAPSPTSANGAQNAG